MNGNGNKGGGTGDGRMHTDGCHEETLGICVKHVHDREMKRRHGGGAAAEEERLLTTSR